MSYTEQEYEDFEKRMHERFPGMFSNPYGGFAVGKGWWPIIEILCENIQRHIDWKNSTRSMLLKDNPYDIKVPDELEQVVVAQIKEKFGTLRFYYDGGDDVIRGMVKMAEAWADSSCEECRAPGSRRSGGWVRTLCDTHEEIHQKQINERFKNDAKD